MMTNSKTEDQQNDDLPFVIGAGLGRTGTHSLLEALIVLGYGRPYHMQEIKIKNPSLLAPWYDLAIAERQSKQKNETMALEVAQSVIDLGYRATTDFPACLLYREFMELQPNGKVILSIRSKPKDWKKSVLETIGVISIPLLKAPFSFVPHFQHHAGMVHPWLFERMGGIANLGQIKVPDESLLDKQYADKLEDAYTQWVQEVKRTVPPEKLLVHHPKDGYPPLCSFFGISTENCPQEAYPHISDTQQFRQTIRVLEGITMLFWPGVVVLGLLLAWGSIRKKTASNCGMKKKE